MQYWCRKSHRKSKNAKEKTFRVETKWQYHITLHSKAISVCGRLNIQILTNSNGPSLQNYCKLKQCNLFKEDKKACDWIFCDTIKRINFGLFAEYWVKWIATLAKVTQPLLSPASNLLHICTWLNSMISWLSQYILTTLLLTAYCAKQMCQM